ncbi:MAG TPA: hypothetical protein VM367_01750 [Pseudonocardia sp.]|jgi:hypothetical protein|nr:hypothetical protein [Pseudonocardia sp.]
MSNDDVDVLGILERLPQLGEAQIWEIVRRCRVFRAHPDGEDQVVELEISRDTAGRWLGIARDEARDLTAQGVPMPGLNGALNMVPWYVLDDPAKPDAS